MIKMENKMKTNVFSIMLCSLALMLGLSACDKRAAEPFDLDGDCMVTALALDDYEGKI